MSNLQSTESEKIAIQNTENFLSKINDLKWPWQCLVSLKITYQARSFTFDRGKKIIANIFSILSYFSFLNHTMHTSTAIFVTIEMFAQFRQYPSKKAAFIGLLIFGTSYASWITFGKLYGGIWIYPVIEKFNLAQLLIGPVFVFCYEGSFYLGGEFLNNFIWRKTLSEIKERKCEEKGDPLMSA